MQPPHPSADLLTAGFVIGEWTVLPSRNVIERQGEPIHLEPRVMDVLVHLARRHGDAVSKDELAAHVWKSQFISDETLTVTIYSLRKALGDDARHPRYVQTVSRRGYRLIPVPQAITSTASRHVEAPAATTRMARARWSRVVSAAVAACLVLAAGTVWMLRGDAGTRHVPRAEAREAYLKGRYFLDQRSMESWRQALEQFQLAITLDPNDPAGHAGLADTYSAMADFGIATSGELRPRAMAEASRALHLDARSAEAHGALGRAQFIFDWDFAAAEQSLTRALALDSAFMPAYQAMAWLKSARGDHDGAVAAARRARQLDPVNTARYTELAYVLALGGRHRDALREIERALELSPRSVGNHLMRGWVREVAGEPEQAFEAYLTGLRVVAVQEASLKRYEAAYRERGLPGFFQEVLAWSATVPQASETWRAQLYTRAGEPERAIQALERAYAKREGALAWMSVEPTFRPLHSDARFRQIAAQVARRN
jgi:DNA-binding winged helix-turn-helix (wHTH) protein/tetratricopeptide (TPR) repeat protein